MMSDSWGSYEVRKDVLLRHSFLCTYPGCQELAGDIHHVDLRKGGGTNELTNLLGLCNKHHKWVHKDETALELDSVTHEWVPRLMLVKYWLIRQLKETRVRVSGIEREELYTELKKSTETPEHFWQQKHPIYNRNHWTAYEVFLKATWNYLCDCSNERSATGALVLYRKLWLYRRRHGQLRAANTVAKELGGLLKELPERNIAWIVGKVKYEMAYMKFMEDPLDTQVIGIFEDSARLERKVGNQSGALVSHATALMVRLLQENSPLFDDFLRTQDFLSRYSDPLAIHWCKYNLNYLMAI